MGAEQTEKTLPSELWGPGFEPEASPRALGPRESPAFSQVKVRVAHPLVIYKLLSLKQALWESNFPITQNRTKNIVGFFLIQFRVLVRLKYVI